MSEVERAAISAAEAYTKCVINQLCDADNCPAGYRNRFTIDQVEKLVKSYGGRL